MDQRCHMSSQTNAICNRSIQHLEQGMLAIGPSKSWRCQTRNISPEVAGLKDQQPTSQDITKTAHPHQTCWPLWCQRTATASHAVVGDGIAGRNIDVERRRRASHLSLSSRTIIIVSQSQVHGPGRNTVMRFCTSATLKESQSTAEHHYGMMGFIAAHWVPAFTEWRSAFQLGILLEAGNWRQIGERNLFSTCTTHHQTAAHHNDQAWELFFVPDPNLFQITTQSANQLAGRVAGTVSAAALIVQQCTNAVPEPSTTSIVSQILPC